MSKICFIQKELKDDCLNNETEIIKFQILNVLSESDFDVDIICVNNFLKNNYCFNNILEISEDDFYQQTVAIAKSYDYDITFSSENVAAEILYVNSHTELFKKYKNYSLFSKVFNWRNKKLSLKDEDNQKDCTQNAELIFVPSSILKNDLINNFHIDGQKIFILPPYVNADKTIGNTEHNMFTFGFMAKDFISDGGTLLLRALAKINDYEFKVKIITSFDKLPYMIKLLIKFYNLEDKIEFLFAKNDLANFYDSIDCFVMPSYIESFGVHAMTAMSKGKLTIVSSKCGIKDIIEHDSNGFIFDITNNPVKNLERAMLYILVNKYDFENVQHNSMYTASVCNLEKFKSEFFRVLNNYLKSKKDVK